MDKHNSIVIMENHPVSSVPLDKLGLQDVNRHMQQHKRMQQHTPKQCLLLYSFPSPSVSLFDACEGSQHSAKQPQRTKSMPNPVSNSIPIEFELKPIFTCLSFHISFSFRLCCFITYLLLLMMLAQHLHIPVWTASSHSLHYQPLSIPRIHLNLSLASLHLTAPFGSTRCYQLSIVVHRLSCCALPASISPSFIIHLTITCPGYLQLLV